MSFIGSLFCLREEDGVTEVFIPYRECDCLGYDAEGNPNCFWFHYEEMLDGNYHSGSNHAPLSKSDNLVIRRPIA